MQSFYIKNVSRCNDKGEISIIKELFSDSTMPSFLVRKKHTSRLFRLNISTELPSASIKFVKDGGIAQGEGYDSVVFPDIHRKLNVIHSMLIGSGVSTEKLPEFRKSAGLEAQNAANSTIRKNMQKGQREHI